MSISDLKSQIISKLSSIEDKSTLEDILRLVDHESKMNDVYRLTDDEKKAVEYGFKDVSEGKTFSSEAAESLIKEWLKK